MCAFIQSTALHYVYEVTYVCNEVHAYMCECAFCMGSSCMYVWVCIMYVCEDYHVRVQRSSCIHVRVCISSRGHLHCMCAVIQSRIVHYVCEVHYVCVQRSSCIHVWVCIHMGWLRSVGSIKLYVSFAEYCLFYKALLQKRPIILSILLTKATSEESASAALLWMFRAFRVERT